MGRRRPRREGAVSRTFRDGGPMLTKPEEVGLSSPRLTRLTEHWQRYIDEGKLAGTLTLVARRGRVAYCESLGHLDLERRRAVTPESVWRIYSMTKPIVSVGL